LTNRYSDVFAAEEITILHVTDPIRVRLRRSFLLLHSYSACLHDPPGPRRYINFGQWNVALQRPVQLGPTRSLFSSPQPYFLRSLASRSPWLALLAATAHYFYHRIDYAIFN
jgi:hypothetical protein